MVCLLQSVINSLEPIWLKCMNPTAALISHWYCTIWSHSVALECKSQQNA